MQYQRRDLNLKVDDKAWLYTEEWPYPEIVTITGECDEGEGYEAVRANGDTIHTCNGTLLATRKAVRAENLRIAKKRRKEYAETQAKYTRAIQWLDWVIHQKGKV